jgi:hypothetical protein
LIASGHGSVARLDIKNSSAYDAPIRKKFKEGNSGEQLFFELALEVPWRCPTAEGNAHE